MSALLPQSDGFEGFRPGPIGGEPHEASVAELDQGPRVGGELDAAATASRGDAVQDRGPGRRPRRSDVPRFTCAQNW